MEFNAVPVVLQRLLAMAVVALWVPLLSFIPAWLIGLMLALLVWRQAGPLRVLVFNGTALVIVPLVIVLLHRQFNTWTGPEFGVSLLSLLISMKYLEIRSLREARTLVLAGLFLLGCSYLFRQSLLWVLYSVFNVLLLVRILYELTHRPVALKNAPSVLGPRQFYPWRFSLGLLAQSIPMLVLFFVLFPRIPPLWSVAVPTGAQTGLSEVMAPGDIAHMNKSFTEAFRVYFSGQVAPSAERYWRVMVLDRFDGRAWHRHNAADLLEPLRRGEGETEGSGRSEVVKYRIRLLIPLLDAQAPSLAVPLAAEGPPLLRTPEALLQFAAGLPPHPEYTLMSALDQPLHSGATPEDLRQDLQLPLQHNQRTMMQARQWRAAVASDTDYVRFLLHYFQQNFRYTLTPPLLGEEAIDDFMFFSHQGFCEHFASAMAVLLRSAAIPARVVIGYQGGAFSVAGDYLSVRQLDAHAWVEAWLGQSWVRIDPTAVIAPERIRLGEDQMAQQKYYWGKSRNSWWAWRRYELSSQLSRWADTANDIWDRHVVFYNAEALKLPGPSRWSAQQRRTGFLILGFIGLIALLSAVLLHQRRTPEDPLTATYRRFMQRMAQWQQVPVTGETAEQWAKRLALCYPAQSNLLLQHAQLYQRLKFSVGSQEDSRFRKRVFLWQKLQYRLLDQLRRAHAVK